MSDVSILQSLSVPVLPLGRKVSQASYRNSGNGGAWGYSYRTWQPQESGVAEPVIEDNDLDIEDVLMSPDGHKLIVPFIASAKISSPRIEKVDFTSIFSAKNPAVRGKAVEALGDIFSEMMAISHAPDRMMRARTVRALRALSIKALPSVGGVLADPAAAIRKQAVKALGKMGEYSTEQIPCLEVCLQDPDQLVRRYTVAALLEIRCSLRRSHGVGEWKDKQSAHAVASEICLTMMRCQEGHEVSLPANVISLLDTGLLKAEEVACMLRDEDLDVRCKAAVALGSMGQRAYPYLRNLVVLLQEPNSIARICAMVAVRKMGGAAAAQVEALLEDPDFNVRRSAIGALTGIHLCGPQDSHASREATELAFLLVRDCSLVPDGVAAALSLVRTKQVRALELVTLLQDPDDALRTRAAEALGNLGSEALPYAKRIWPLLKDPNEAVKNAANNALDQMNGPKPSPAELKGVASKDLPRATVVDTSTSRSSPTAIAPHEAPGADILGNSYTFTHASTVSNLRRGSHIPAAMGASFNFRPWQNKDPTVPAVHLSAGLHPQGVAGHPNIPAGMHVATPLGSHPHGVHGAAPRPTTKQSASLPGQSATSRKTEQNGAAAFSQMASLSKQRLSSVSEADGPKDTASMPVNSAVPKVVKAEPPAARTAKRSSFSIGGENFANQA